MLLYPYFYGSPESIWTSCILTEKVICFPPPGNTPTLQYYKGQCIFNSIKLILNRLKLVLQTKLVSTNR